VALFFILSLSDARVLLLLSLSLTWVPAGCGCNRPARIKRLDLKRVKTRVEELAGGKSNDPNRWVQAKQPEQIYQILMHLEWAESHPQSLGFNRPEALSRLDEPASAGAPKEDDDDVMIQEEPSADVESDRINLDDFVSLERHLDELLESVGLVIISSSIVKKEPLQGGGVLVKMEEQSENVAVKLDAREGQRGGGLASMKDIEIEAASRKRVRQEGGQGHESVWIVMRSVTLPYTTLQWGSSPEVQFGVNGVFASQEAAEAARVKYEKALAEFCRAQSKIVQEGGDNLAALEKTHGRDFASSDHGAGHFQHEVCPLSSFVGLCVCVGVGESKSGRKRERKRGGESVCVFVYVCVWVFVRCVLVDVCVHVCVCVCMCAVTCRTCTGMCTQYTQQMVVVEMPVQAACPSVEPHFDFDGNSHKTRVVQSDVVNAAILVGPKMTHGEAYECETAQHAGDDDEDGASGGAGSGAEEEEEKPGDEEKPGEEEE